MSAEAAGGPIHIVLTFDENFWAPAYATMRSICLASRRREGLEFHLMHLGLNATQRADLDSIAVEFGAKVNYTDLSQLDLYRDLATRLPRRKKSFAPLLYARLLIDDFLLGDIARFVYADCDTLFRAPIEAIAEIDLGGKALAAVEDPNAMLLCNGRDVKENRDLFDPAVPYFNSGLMVIDRAAWRAADPASVLDRLIAEGRVSRLFYDQDVLNIAFRDNWLRLDQRWNLIRPLPQLEGLNPFMLHYTGKRKPWKPVSRLAFARIYRHVMTNDLFYRYWGFRWRRAWRRRFGWLAGGG